MQFSDSIKLEILKAVFSLMLLLVSWVIGQAIIASWDLKKKRQELDILTATQFHKFYGEFKELSRLWRILKFSGDPGKKTCVPENARFDLLKRAAAAEGGVEAITLKLVTEKHLEDEDVETLGLFRQAYQKLREAIRDDKPFEWTYNKPEYKLFNDLAGKTACIIFKSKPGWPDSKNACAILSHISDIRAENWEKAIELVKQPKSNRSTPRRRRQ